MYYNHENTDFEENVFIHVFTTLTILTTAYENVK